MPVKFTTRIKASLALVIVPVDVGMQIEMLSERGVLLRLEANELRTAFEYHTQ
jgi:hypothetical protein